MKNYTLTFFLFCPFNSFNILYCQPLIQTHMLKLRYWYQFDKTSELLDRKTIYLSSPCIPPDLRQNIQKYSEDGNLFGLANEIK